MMMPTLHRPAIAMIELIFAIVIMGIVMMSAPMLISTASNSGYVAIQQEGINEAATQMSIMMDYPWDANNIVDTNTTVLNVSNGDDELNGTLATPKRRAGTPANSNRVYLNDAGDDNINASAIGLDAPAEAIDDIDDFDGTTVNLNLIAASAADYIEKGVDINISRTVGYMDDNATNYNTGGDGNLTYTPNFTNVSPSTNIKRLQVTLTSTSGVDELKKTITLHAFSCNIGTYKLEER